MEYIISFSTNLLNYFSYDNITSTFFKSNKSQRIKCILYIFSYLFLNILCESIMENMSLGKQALIFFTYFFIFYFLYKSIYFAIIYFIWKIVSASFEIFTISIFMYILDASISELLSNVLYFISVTFTHNITLFLFSVLFKVILKERIQLENTSLLEGISICIFPLINYSIIYLILYDNLEIGQITSSINIRISLLLIISTFLLFFFLAKINENNKNKAQLLINAKDEKSKNEYIAAVKNAYDVQRQLTHDYNRELSTLKSILELKDYVKLETYLNKLVGNSQKNKLVVLTHNTIIDAILNQKYTEASNHNIGMEFILDDLSGLPITDQDLVTILTNSIDNAIAAAKDSSAKLIQIFMTYSSDEFLYVIKNSIVKKVDVENNIIINPSTNIYHGFGLKNIKSALERYDSILSLESSDDRFLLSILINF